MIHKDEAFDIIHDVRKATEQYCDYIIGPKIRKSAIEGFCDVTIEVPFSIDLDYAIVILKKYGYNIENDKGLVHIFWDTSFSFEHYI